MIDVPKAYGMGRQAAMRGGSIPDIVEPAFDRLLPARMAEACVKAFWDGVRDLRAEDRINRED